MSKVYSDDYLRKLWNLWVLTQPDQSYKVVYANFDEMRRHVPSAPHQWLELIGKMDEFRPRELMQLRKSLTTNTLEIYQGSMEGMWNEENLEELVGRVNRTSFVTTAVEMLFNKQYDNVRHQNEYIFRMLDDIALVGRGSMALFMTFTDLPRKDCVAFMVRLLSDEHINAAKFIVDESREEVGMIAALAAAVMRKVQTKPASPSNGDFVDYISKLALELFKDPEWAKKLVIEWVDKIRAEGRSV